MQPLSTLPNREGFKFRGIRKDGGRFMNCRLKHLPGTGMYICAAGHYVYKDVSEELVGWEPHPARGRAAIVNCGGARRKLVPPTGSRKGLNEPHSARKGSEKSVGLQPDHRGIQQARSSEGGIGGTECAAESIQVCEPVDSNPVSVGRASLEQIHAKDVDPAPSITAASFS